MVSYGCPDVLGECRQLALYLLRFLGGFKISQQVFLQVQVSCDIRMWFTPNLAHISMSTLAMFLKPQATVTSNLYINERSEAIVHSYSMTLDAHVDHICIKGCRHES